MFGYTQSNGLYSIQTLHNIFGTYITHDQNLLTFHILFLIYPLSFANGLYTQRNLYVVIELKRIFFASTLPLCVIIECLLKPFSIYTSIAHWLTHTVTCANQHTESARATAHALYALVCMVPTWIHVHSMTLKHMSIMLISSLLTTWIGNTNCVVIDDAFLLFLLFISHE